MADYRNNYNRKPKKSPILGQSHGLSDIEGEMIQQMIREEQHSARELYIPTEDLAQEATTRMAPEVAQVIEESGAGIVYADAFDQPRIAYQSGSIRDNFDFGPVIALSTKGKFKGIPLDRLVGEIIERLILGLRPRS